MLPTRLLILVLNALLEHNLSCRKLLIPYCEKIAKIYLPIGQLLISIDENGFLIQKDSNSSCDVEITIPAISLLSYINKENINTLNNIIIIGNLDCARSILEAFASLDIIYSLEKKINLPTYILHPILSKLKQLFNYLKYITKNNKTSFSEYLLYEKQVITTKFEIKDFCNQVDNIKSRTEILNKKVNLWILNK